MHTPPRRLLAAWCCAAILAAGPAYGAPQEDVPDPLGREAPAHGVEALFLPIILPLRMLQQAAGLVSPKKHVAYRASQLVLLAGGTLRARGQAYDRIEVASKMQAKLIAAGRLPQYAGRPFSLLETVCQTGVPGTRRLRGGGEPYVHRSPGGAEEPLFGWVMRRLPLTRAEIEQAEAEGFGACLNRDLVLMEADGQDHMGLADAAMQRYLLRLLRDIASARP